MTVSDKTKKTENLGDFLKDSGKKTIKCIKKDGKKRTR